MSRNLVLEDFKLPFLTIENYRSQDEDHTTFIITTMDKYVYVVRSNDTNDAIIHKLKIQSPANCVCMDQQLSVLWLGCINGCMLKYDTRVQSLRTQKYIEGTQQRPQLLCIYRRKQTVFGWNLNSQAVLINCMTMEIKDRISFGYDITSAIYLNNNLNLQMYACIAFQNNLPPFIFDCETGTQMKESFKFLTKDYTDNSQKIDEQIVLMSDQKNRPDCDFIVCATIEHKPILEHYICKYSILKQQKYRICQLQLRIKFEYQPIFMNLHEQYLVVCFWENVHIINLQKRKTSCTITNRCFRWAFAIKIHVLDNRRIYLMSYSKGFNFLSPGQSKIGKTSIHINRTIE